MAAIHQEIRILNAEASPENIIVYFSDGTTSLFRSHFLYEVREHNGNVDLTEKTDEQLMEGFDE